VSEDCLKLTTYFGERDRAGRRLLADALLDLYGGARLQTSVLFRGVEGFGRLRQLRTDRLLSLSEDLPVVAIAVDARERVEGLLPDVLAIAQKGLVTLERARLLDGGLDGLPAPEPDAEAKLTVYLGRRQRVGGQPAFAAATELLRRRGLDGASVLLGVDGTRRGERSRARLLGANADVPTTLIAVGPGSLLSAALPELEQMLERPLATVERVRVCKRDGKLLAVPHELPGSDEHGIPLTQKLSVYTSHDATRDGVPLHLAIVRELRAAGAAGATCLRGIWGFHGEHAPHGERLLQLRRKVPVLTVAIDEPERIGNAFEVIDALTSEHGLVTSEMVPAASDLSGPERWRNVPPLARHQR
jgi:PII-like signaling protein